MGVTTKLIHFFFSHDHNYHHEDDEGEGGIVDPDHDPLQHTPAAERFILRGF